MVIPDLNLLLYAYNPNSRFHQSACSWWETIMNGQELIGLPNEILLGFVRIATQGVSLRQKIPR